MTAKQAKKIRAALAAINKMGVTAEEVYALSLVNDFRNVAVERAEDEATNAKETTLDFIENWDWDDTATDLASRVDEINRALPW